MYYRFLFRSFIHVITFTFIFIFLYVYSVCASIYINDYIPFCQPFYSIRTPLYNKMTRKYLAFALEQTFLNVYIHPFTV